jgi:1-aminocyclopropane-1-carboxylate deaminase
MLRLDQLDKDVSGNKWFKLKYNLEQALKQSHTTVLTFGGAFSNHIAATAAACKKYKLKSVGIIRGEEDQKGNPTLKTAIENGMELHFVSREEYSKKSELQFKEDLLSKFGDHYLIPEGGNNAEGVLGCMEILKPDWKYDYIVCACGTGTTYAGIAASTAKDQIVLGIGTLKGENKLPVETEGLLRSIFTDKEIAVAGNAEINAEFIRTNCITNNYCFSGYAKFDKELVEFKNQFEKKFEIVLDYVYTNKLAYAVFDLVAKRKFRSGSKILMIHSGGLQGNAGFENRYHLIPNL